MYIIEQLYEYTRSAAWPRGL